MTGKPEVTSQLSTTHQGTIKAAVVSVMGMLRQMTIRGDVLTQARSVMTMVEADPTIVQPC